MVICWTPPLGIVAVGVVAVGVVAVEGVAVGVVAVGVAAPSVIVKIGLVAARYWVVVTIPPPRRPVPETLSISIQFASPPDGFAVHCTTWLSTTTSLLTVKVSIANSLKMLSFSPMVTARQKKRDYKYEMKGERCNTYGSKSSAWIGRWLSTQNSRQPQGFLRRCRRRL